MEVRHNGIGYIVCSKKPPLKTLEEMNEYAKKVNNPSLMRHPDSKSFAIDFTEIMIGAHSKELQEHFGAKVTKEKKIYFSTKEEAEKALLYLDSQIVASRLITSK